MLECDECLKPIDFEVEIYTNCHDCGKGICENCRVECATDDCENYLCKTCTVNDGLCDDCLTEKQLTDSPDSSDRFGNFQCAGCKKWAHKSIVGLNIIAGVKYCDECAKAQSPKKIADKSEGENNG